MPRAAVIREAARDRGRRCRVCGINKFLAENTLMGQPSVKDDKLSTVRRKMLGAKEDEKAQHLHVRPVGRGPSRRSSPTFAPKWPPLNKERGVTMAGVRNPKRTPAGEARLNRASSSSSRRGPADWAARWPLLASPRDGHRKRRRQVKEISESRARCARVGVVSAGPTLLWRLALPRFGPDAPPILHLCMKGPFRLASSTASRPPSSGTR